MSLTLKKNKAVFIIEILSIATVVGGFAASLASSNDSFPLMSLGKILIFHGIAVVLLIASLVLIAVEKLEWLADILRWAAVITVAAGFGYLFSGRMSLLGFTYIVGLATANESAMSAMNISIAGWVFDVAAMVLIAVGGFWKLKRIKE